MTSSHTTSPEKPLNEKRKSSFVLENGLVKDEKKIGHRRVLDNGSVTYKKRLTSELMAAVQLGISQSVGSQLPSRDILYEDFHVVVTVQFPREGSSLTPAHHCSDFCFRSYAPAVFRYFRNIFKIKPADFLLSLCSDPLKELPNPGASGSIFYVTQSDEFIIKTVQHKEAEFLQKLLPGYYMNLNQNPCTLLPKFYGLFCYQSGGKNIRFVVMNNILTSDLPLYCKFDLKGSTHKRKASKNEKTKKVPTLKDLDFRATFPTGLLLDADTHDALVKTLDRDCRVLESFKIMDYSILIGVHKVLNDDDKKNEEELSLTSESDDVHKAPRTRIGQFSTPMESIQAPCLAYNSGQIPAWGSNDERLLLNVGIIDILQNYRISKKLEHAFKSIVHDGDSVSVHHPSFYAHRFKKFCSESVFKSTKPAKRKSVAGMKKPSMDAESMPDFLKPGVYARRQMKLKNGEHLIGNFSDSQPSLHPHQPHPHQPHHFSNNYSTSSLLSVGTSTTTHYTTDATHSYTDSSLSFSIDNIREDDVPDDESHETENSGKNSNPSQPIHPSHPTHQSTPTLSPSHPGHLRTSSNPSFTNFSLYSKASVQTDTHTSSAAAAVFSISPHSTLSSTHSKTPSGHSASRGGNRPLNTDDGGSVTNEDHRHNAAERPSSGRDLIFPKDTLLNHTQPSFKPVIVRINSQSYLTKL